ncbi:MAG: imidazoleglycerol-phosphate dehydratase HisB [Armatimonadetes bacterium]|nr:imidazoleglycerol-phosphate dehydratase HisB [Armatimonadota bacterium]
MAATHPDRTAEIRRETAETQISVALNLDRATGTQIETGIGFLDHMLEQFAFHGRFGLQISCQGDLAVDDHHTVEDVGIALGQAIKSALGMSPVERFGSLHAPMDDALMLVAMDISGRAFLGFEATFMREMLGELSTECIREFFRALTAHSGITLHIRQEAGFNEHHLCEALFKGFGVALHRATRAVERPGVSSTKGVI